MFFSNIKLSFLWPFTVSIGYLPPIYQIISLCAAKRVTFTTIHNVIHAFCVLIILLCKSGFTLSELAVDEKNIGFYHVLHLFVKLVAKQPSECYATSTCNRQYRDDFRRSCCLSSAWIFRWFDDGAAIMLKNGASCGLVSVDEFSGRFSPEKCAIFGDREMTRLCCCCVSRADTNRSDPNQQRVVK